MGPDDKWQFTYIAAVDNDETLMMYMPFVASHDRFGPQGIGGKVAQMYENSGPIVNYDEWQLGDPHEVELPVTSVP